MNTIDIAVLGSGIAGNLAAAYLRQHLPNLSTTLIGRSDRNLPTVGESTVEISANLIREIGLSDYLIQEHYPKYALTYYYKADYDNPEDQTYYVSESPTIPPFPSFQVNRFSFDKHIRQLNEAAGVQYVNAHVTDIQIGDGAPHDLTLTFQEGHKRYLTARWVIDATGRARFLSRRLGLQESPHIQRDAFWFRLRNFDDSLLRNVNARAIKKQNRAYDPYYATHHFFGWGNWIWCIPLKTNDCRNLISMGIVYRRDIYPYRIRAIEAFLSCVESEHSVIRQLVDSGEVLDTNFYGNYMYETKQKYSSQGWYIIGDAASTVDALYSLGLAVLSIAITQVAELIRRDLVGINTVEFVKDVNDSITIFHNTATDDITKLYEVMHDPYQCAHRQHLSFLMSLHLGLPYMYSGLMYDPVGVKLWNKFGAAEIGSAGVKPLYDLIARVAKKRIHIKRAEVAAIQSVFTMNYRYYEWMREEDWAKSAAEMYFYLLGFRLRLLWQYGWKGLFWFKQYRWMLQDCCSAVLLTVLFRGTRIRDNPLIRACVGLSHKPVRKRKRTSLALAWPMKS